MKLEFVKASDTDAEKLVEVQDKSFYADYVKYGVCPGYGRTTESMAASINRNTMFKIIADGILVGNVCAHENGNGTCHLDCLCVVPEYENRGIGKSALFFIEKYFPQASEWSLETPADKTRNICFYQNSGYSIVDRIADGPVEIAIMQK